MTELNGMVEIWRRPVDMKPYVGSAKVHKLLWPTTLSLWCTIKDPLTNIFENRGKPRHKSSRDEYTFIALYFYSNHKLCAVFIATMFMRQDTHKHIPHRHTHTHTHTSPQNTPLASGRLLFSAPPKICLRL